MQTLFVKTATGEMKEVTVHRSWQEAGGTAVYLHANGRYAYKDGTPLKKREELDILPGAQRKMAQLWWDRIGGQESKAFYKSIETQAEAVAGDFQDNLLTTTELDSALYVRRSAKGGAVSAPHAWMEWFTKRPDWWGQAKVIGFADYIYEMAVIEEKPEAEKTALVDQAGTAGGKKGGGEKEKAAEQNGGAGSSEQPGAGDPPDDTGTGE
jgi:hypothetical protein